MDLREIMQAEFQKLEASLLCRMKPPALCDCKDAQFVMGLRVSVSCFTSRIAGVNLSS